MGKPNIIYKNFRNFGGLDLRTSDLLREKGTSTGMVNADFRETGALNKRKGSKYRARYDLGSSDIVGSGVFSWRNTDIDDGTSTEELLYCGQDLFKLETETITITHSPSGAAEVPTMSCLLNETTNVFEFVLKEDGTAVATIGLGTGRSGLDKDITGLETDIDAVTRFAMSTPVSSGSEKAAFIEPFENRSFTSNTATFEVKYLSKIDVPNGSSLKPFENHWARRNQSDFENISSVDINNVIYFSNGFDNLMKYDGNRVYRAGLPQVTFSTINDGSAGAEFTTNDICHYTANFEYTDTKGNIITGELGTNSHTVTHGSGGVVSINVNINQITATEDFNTDENTVTAVPSASTIQFTAATNFKVGDYVYYNNGSSILKGRVQSISTTAITNDTIELDTVTTGATGVVSCIKVSLWRNEVPSTSSLSTDLKVLVEEKTNNTAAAFAFVDSTHDRSGGVELVEPLKAHTLPVKGKYLTSWRGLLLVGGKIDEVDTMYYSDIDSPEYFPSANNLKFNLPVTGLGTLNNIAYVFQNRAISGITGDLTTDNVSVNEVSREGIGCEAHATIQEVASRLWFLSSEGIFAISPEGLEEMSEPISPKFGPLNEFSFKQAVAINVTKWDKYLILLPKLGTISNKCADLSGSEIYVYDYFRRSWLEWDKIVFMGGIVEHNEEVWFSPRSAPSSGTEPDSYPSIILENQRFFDYADHENAITFSYSTHWEALGEPTIWKKFLRLKMHSLDTTVNTFESDAFNLRVTTQHNWELKDIADLTLDFSGGAEGWGLGPWGEFPWGEPRLLSSKNKLASRKVRSHRFTFLNSTVYENVLISGYEVEIVTPYNAFIKE